MTPSFVTQVSLALHGNEERPARHRRPPLRLLWAISGTPPRIQDKFNETSNFSNSSALARRTLLSRGTGPTGVP